MGERIEFESDFSFEKPVVFVDSNKYGNPHYEDDETGEYYRSDDKLFRQSTAEQSLDLEIIIEVLASHMKGLDIPAPTSTTNYFFQPTQDIEEIQKRQDIIKDLYENDENYNLVGRLVTAARNLYKWTPNFLKNSENYFDKRTEQISNLVDVVESGLLLKAKSERLKRVKKFAREISKREEYQQLKTYVSKSATNLFKQYRVNMGSLKKIWGMPNDGIFTTGELAQLYAKISRRKSYSKDIEELDVNTRRNIYFSLKNLKKVVYKLMHDKELDGIIDKEEAKTFNIEDNLNTAIEMLGNTCILNFEEKAKVEESHKFFLNQFGKLIYHIDQLIDEGLVRRMGALNVNTDGMEKELAFYHGMAYLARKMSYVSPVVLPTILDKKKRYCKIKEGNVASRAIRKSIGSIKRGKGYVSFGNIELVPNDVLSNAQNHVFVITGANNNGKTTYERMIGQAQTLAQVGGYVPAKEAKLSIVDGIFTSFHQKDKPGEETGSFMSELQFLSFITVPQELKRGESIKFRGYDIRQTYYNYDQPFITPYSLVLLDEIAIGSDSEATEEAIERMLNTAVARGSRLYLSTHYHPIAERIENGDFERTMNLGAVMNNRYNPPKLTWKIKRNRHEPSCGKRIFEKVSFVDDAIASAQERMNKTGWFEF